MNIREFSLNLQKLFEEMSTSFSTYQLQSGLHCMSGCGRCCLNPEVEASMYEMIPFALKVYDEGKIDEWLLFLESQERPHCALFQDQGNGKGFCGSYHERPSVCRMFGVAGRFDKKNEVSLSICKHLRSEYPAITEKLTSEKNSDAPMLTHWSSKLANLDPELTKNRVPLNDAMKGALQKVAFYAQFQPL